MPHRVLARCLTPAQSLLAEDLLLQSNDVTPADFVELLRLAAPNLEEAQRYLSKSTSESMPRSSYWDIWDTLTSWQEKADAATLVFDLTLHFGGRRLRDALSELDRDGDVARLPDDRGFMDVLFFDNGKPRKPGQLLLAHWRETRKKSKPSRPSSARSSRRGKPSLAEMGEALSAPSGSGHRLERVSVSPSAMLRIDPTSLESDIEAHIATNWASIDFGLAERLHLRYQQYQIPGVKGRVDFIAQTEGGVWHVIELKKDDATGNDYTQLKSYMTNVARAFNTDIAKVHGILLAAGFRVRVLDAATHDDNVMLLRFLKEDS